VAWGVGIVACLVTLGGLVYLIHSVMNSKVEPPKQVVQEVRIIRPPPPEELPPPPPPPPPEEKVDLEEPVPQDEAPSNDPPPGDQLGVDATGTGAGDGFGLVGRPGGRDLLASGGSAFTWYAGMIKNQILDLLDEEKQARSGAYSVVVRVWVGHDGRIEKATLQGSSGNRERDKVIERALSQLRQLSQAPPANMPQPVSLRIVSRA
jgi:protein TonB